MKMQKKLTLNRFKMLLNDIYQNINNASCLCDKIASDLFLLAVSALVTLYIILIYILNVILYNKN